jgi:hypothetical protein
MAGATQLVNGTTFESVGFQPTGDFEVKFPSNMLDDLWIVMAWAVAEAFSILNLAKKFILLNNE